MILTMECRMSDNIAQTKYNVIMCRNCSLWTI